MTFPVHVSDPSGKYDSFESYLNDHYHPRWRIEKPYNSHYLVIQEFFERFGSARGGGSKLAFIDSDGDVIKVPHHQSDEDCLESEVRTYQRYISGDPGIIPIAHCFLERYRGVLIERMELVTRHDIPRDNYPEWVSEVDCEQVGYNRAGELVAFDL